jgi:tRNA U34 5-methylaminomethyl-2-thiouridine-forming methyltransferase MnmC
MSSPSEALQILTTGDGSLTFYSEEFGQPFHNLSGAYQEALEKFVLPCNLHQLAASQSQIHLLDVCFGLGYNSGVAVETIRQINPDCQVHLIGLERSPTVPTQACSNGLWSRWDFALAWAELLPSDPDDQDGRADPVAAVCTDRLHTQIFWGDARQTIGQVPLHWADAVFLDPFSPSVCPELWTVEFLEQIARRIRSNGRLTTYSCAAAVRAGLLLAGFSIGSTPPIGRPWPGTVASLTDKHLPTLSQSELEHLHTRAAVPYRDPSLTAQRHQIQTMRQQQQHLSTLEPTSVWKKRWDRGETTKHAILPGHPEPLPVERSDPP